MSTYLELVKKVARESGTISGGEPVTLTNLRGRLLKMAFWTNDAWTDIQISRPTWRWMRSEFSGETIGNVQRYNSLSLGINVRFARWMTPIQETEGVHIFCKEASAPKSTKTPLRFVNWEDFYNQYIELGSELPSRPQMYTVTPNDEIALYPIPDGAYTISGRYLKSPQDLIDDGDIPEMPNEFHSVIAWYALIRMSVHDEAFSQLPHWEINRRKIMGFLETSELPKITVGGPLA